MNKRIEIDISENEEYVSSIISIERLRFEEKTFVRINASNKIIKECLCQDLKRKVVSYYSRKLSSTEQNYTIEDKEMLAIISTL